MALVRKRQFPTLTAMFDIEEREIKWLWYPYIPMGMATMMYGRGGIGKSHIACDIAARISTGEPFPGQENTRPAGNVLMLSAEDDYASVLKPRLRKAGADMSRIYVPEDENFVLDAIGIRQLEEYMRQMSAAIVFIDPIAFYLGGKVDMNRMNEVREFTGALHQAAKAAGCAIVLVHHSKKGDTADYDKAAGSVDFVNAMRSTLYVDKSPDGVRTMKNPKNNNAHEGRTLAFEFADEVFQWLHDYEDGGEVGQIIKKNTAKAAAVAFIKEMIKDGPIPALDVRHRAEDEGLVWRTVERAKAGIAESYATRINGTMTWYWRPLGAKKHKLEIKESKKSVIGFAQPKETTNGTTVHDVEERAEDQISASGRRTGNRSDVDTHAAGGPVVRDGETGPRGRDSGTGGLSGAAETGRTNTSTSASVGSDFEAEINRILAAQQTRGETA